jgi:hypothetical protein
LARRAAFHRRPSTDYLHRAAQAGVTWTQAREMGEAEVDASNCTFAEATLTQSPMDFVASGVRALEYWGWAPKIAVRHPKSPVQTASGDPWALVRGLFPVGPRCCIVYCAHFAHHDHPFRRIVIARPTAS